MSDSPELGSDTLSDYYRRMEEIRRASGSTTSLTRQGNPAEQALTDIATKMRYKRGDGKPNEDTPVQRLAAMRRRVQRV